MRVGVLARLELDTDIDAKFAEIREMDMNSCQLVCWEMGRMNRETADQVLAAKEKYGIDITAVWCGWQGPKVWDFYDGQETLGLVPPVFRESRLKDLILGSSFAEMLGIPHVVTHVGYMPENPLDPNYHAVIAALRYLVKITASRGQVFLFETGQETPVTLLRAMEDIEAVTGRGTVGVNLDPANLILYGKANPVDSLDVFGKYVLGIHGKDGLYPTDGIHLGKEVPIGQGKVRFPDFVEGLRAVGYDGDITIEREISGAEQKRDIIAGRDYLRSLGLT